MRELSSSILRIIFALTAFASELPASGNPGAVPTFSLEIFSRHGRETVGLSTSSARVATRTFVHPSKVLNPLAQLHTYLVYPLERLPGMDALPTDRRPRVTFVARDGYVTSLAMDSRRLAHGFIALGWAAPESRGTTFTPAPLLTWQNMAKSGSFDPGIDAWWAWWVRAVYVGDDVSRRVNVFDARGVGRSVDLGALPCESVDRPFQFPAGKRDIPVPRIVSSTVRRCGVEAVLAAAGLAGRRGILSVGLASGKRIEVAPEARENHEFLVSRGDSPSTPAFGGPVKICASRSGAYRCAYFVESISLVDAPACVARPTKARVCINLVIQG